MFICSYIIFLCLLLFLLFSLSSFLPISCISPFLFLSLSLSHTHAHTHTHSHTHTHTHGHTHLQYGFSCTCLVSLRLGQTTQAVVGQLSVCLSSFIYEGEELQIYNHNRWLWLYIDVVSMDSLYFWSCCEGKRAAGGQIWENSRRLLYITI